jgi:hypothetical protein
VGRCRLPAGKLAVPLLCSGFSRGRGSYVVVRNFVVCVCVCVCVCNHSCPCSRWQKTRDPNSVLLLVGVDLTHVAVRTSPIRGGGYHSGVGGESSLVGYYTVSPDVSEECSDSIFRVKWSRKNGLFWKVGNCLAVDTATFEVCSDCRILSNSVSFLLQSFLPCTYLFFLFVIEYD